MTEKIPITIIGGGVVGSAIAYELSRSIDDVVLLEKNKKDKRENQSTRNSGVIHAGVYYKPKSLRAVLCVEGNRLLYEFCEKHKVPYKKTGKLVVAAKQWQKEYLLHTLNIAQANNVPGVELITGSEAESFEPNVNCSKGALYVPTSGIVEPISLVEKLQQLARESGAYILCGNEVVDIKPHEDGFFVTTDTFGQGRDNFETEALINVAGLYADEVCGFVNPMYKGLIAIARGETAKFKRSKRPEIWVSGMNIYPAPYVTYNHNGEVAEIPLEEATKLVKRGLATQTAGVHLTPTLGDDKGNYIDDKGNIIVSDTVTIGPAKTPLVCKEDYRPIRDEAYYLKRVIPFFPGLKLDDIGLHQTGNMANPVGQDDWIIARDVRYKNCINLIGINSPGLTGSLAIAKYVSNLLKE